MGRRRQVLLLLGLALVVAGGIAAFLPARRSGLDALDFFVALAVLVAIALPLLGRLKRRGS